MSMRSLGWDTPIGLGPSQREAATSPRLAFMLAIKAMAQQAKKASQNRRGRPATGRGRTIGVRMLPGLLSALDSYRGDMSRPEAVRMLVKQGLISARYLAIADEDT